MSKLSKHPKSHQTHECLNQLILNKPISNKSNKPLTRKITLTQLREMLGYEGKPHA